MHFSVSEGHFHIQTTKLLWDTAYLSQEFRNFCHFLQNLDFSALLNIFLDESEKSIIGSSVYNNSPHKIVIRGYMKWLTNCFWSPVSWVSPRHLIKYRTLCFWTNLLPSNFKLNYAPESEANSINRRIFSTRF